MARRRMPLAVTIGEPAGIGPEVILSAWKNRKTLRLPDFVVIGDAALLTRRAMALAMPVTTAAYEPGDGRSPFSSALPVISVSGAMRAEPGKPEPADAGLVIEAIRTGVAMVQDGQASAIVTANRSKARKTFPFQTSAFGCLASCSSVTALAPAVASLVLSVPGVRFPRAVTRRPPGTCAPCGSRTG